MSAMDKYIDTREWITTMVELGVDPATFDNEAGVMARLKQIEAHLVTFRDTEGSGANAMAAVIAKDPKDYASVISAAINAAAAGDEDRRRAIEDVLDKAGDRIYAEYAAAFKRRRASLLDLLQPVYAAHSEAAKTAWENLPGGVRTLAQADQVGALTEWAQLRDAHEAVLKVRHLITEWVKSGILTADRGLDPLAVMYADHEQALDLHARYGGLRFTGAASAGASPELRDPATVDAAPPRERDDKAADHTRYLQQLEDERGFADALAGRGLRHLVTLPSR